MTLSYPHADLGCLWVVVDHWSWRLSIDQQPREVWSWKLIDMWIYSIDLRYTSLLLGCRCFYFRFRILCWWSTGAVVDQHFILHRWTRNSWSCKQFRKWVLFISNNCPFGDVTMILLLGMSSYLNKDQVGDIVIKQLQCKITMKTISLFSISSLGIVIAI